MAFEDPNAKDPGWQYLRLSAERAAAATPVSQARSLLYQDIICTFLLSIQAWFKTYDSKKSVWIPDPEEGYVAAEIKSVKGDLATVVKFTGGEVGFQPADQLEISPCQIFIYLR